jgi:hypothetical protein
MKTLKITFFFLLFSLCAQAQNYQAPDFKFKAGEGKTPQAKVKASPENDWRSNYKIEDQAQPQRELASEKEEWVDFSERESSRDPSSIPQPMKPNQNPNVRPWLWSGE